MVERSDSVNASSAPNAPQSLREALEEAADGLLHLSESDYPYRFFTLPAEGIKDLTPEGFLNRLGISQQLLREFGVPSDRIVEERSLDDFFPSEEALLERSGADASDPKAASEREKMRRLKEVLRKRLRGLTVFRVGRVEIRCYIVGLDEQGNLAGLVTTAIET